MICGDLRRLPFADGSFAGVWCQAVLLHVPRADVGSTLCELGRVPRAGGVLELAVSEGDGEGWEGSRNPGLPEARRWFVHHREEALTALVIDAGFSVREVVRRAGHRRWLRLRAAREAL